MSESNGFSLRWARNGAILALALSLLSLLLPRQWGGFLAWNDAFWVLQNLAAILARIAVFAAVGGMLGAYWNSGHGTEA